MSWFLVSRQMAPFAHRNNVKPMLSCITFMVMVMNSLIATVTLPGRNPGETMVSNGRIKLILSLSTLRMMFIITLLCIFSVICCIVGTGISPKLLSVSCIVLGSIFLLTGLTVPLKPIGIFRAFLEHVKRFNLTAFGTLFGFHTIQYTPWRTVCK